ncbi:hypothetical protein H4R35_004401 [Dimargaris xerosporica]|nr:hypothetical protein H4R35_004401 [Dimargaris xerosporica]
MLPALASRRALALVGKSAGVRQTAVAFYSEGSIPRAGGSFKEKEKAQENQYIHQQDMAKLKKILEQLEKTEKHVEGLKKELKDHIDGQSKP